MRLPGTDQAHSGEGGRRRDEPPDVDSKQVQRDQRRPGRGNDAEEKQGRPETGGPLPAPPQVGNLRQELLRAERVQRVGTRELFQ
jgi:hypothetical protein